MDRGKEMVVIPTEVKSDAARQRVLRARQRGARVGVVPTMGALHAGHLSLVQACAAECDYTVVTIFVNPTQFGPEEDYEQYPRDLDRDLLCMSDHGVDLVFAPTKDELYRPDHSTYVEPPRVARTLEGVLRPVHFRGVTTVVLKLLNIIPAQVAYFGQKDYQQTCVIRDMIRDLDLPVSIRVCPVIREADGLAMSSRNVYLRDDERQRALAINRALRLAARMFQDGETDAATIGKAMRESLESAVTSLDYAELADPDTLEPVSSVDAQTIALVAAYVGKTRLIDNAKLGESIVAPRAAR